MRVESRALLEPELREAGTVALYAALPHEVRVDRVFRALRLRGARVLLPRVADAALELRLAHDPAHLTPGAFGILEPDGPVVPVTEVDVFLVPGLLFDRMRRRLGFGHGFYDRLLARARTDACLIGLCYAERIVAELPSERTDLKVDRVISDLEVIG